MRYGRKEALCQWRGLLTGFTMDAMAAVLITYFLGTALNKYIRWLTWAGAVYILWLAWHIFRSSGIASEDDPAKPSFRTGLIIQLTNVKVIVFCLTALSSYVLPHDSSLLTLFLTGLFLTLTGPLANLVWVFGGEFLRGLFLKHGKVMDTIMAASLVLCAVSLVWTAF